MDRDKSPVWITFDMRRLVISTILGCIYAAMIWLPVQRRFWHDELFTFYIAEAPTLGRLFEDIRHIDLNPPLLYLLARVAQNAFGATEVATRIPSVLAFFGGSFLMAHFFARRAGFFWAWAAIALFWWSDLFWYSTEARPYSLLFFFFAVTLAARDQAKSLSRLGRPLLGMFAGSCGMMLTHVLAPVTLFAFGAAEFAVLVKERKAAWLRWIALFAPLGLFWVHSFLVANVTGSSFPLAFQASAQKVASFYTALLVSICFLLGIAAVIAFLFRRKLTGNRTLRGFALDDTVLFTALAFTPVLVNLALMQSHGPFFDRYCFTGAFAIVTGAVLLIARAARFNSLAGALVLVLFIGSTMTIKYLEPLSRFRTSSNDSNPLASERPELPIVVASGLTFLEMDHYANAEFLSRVYYLTDLQAALRYAHADMFEGLATVKQYLPVRAQVISYQTFTTRHRRFLVLGTIGYPEDWLLRKLLADQVSVRLIGTFRVPYKDKNLYLIDLDKHA